LKILIENQPEQDSVYFYSIKIENLFGYSIIKIGVSKNVENSCGQFMSKNAHLPVDINVKVLFPTLKDALFVKSKLEENLSEFRTYPNKKYRGSSTWYCDCPGLRSVLSHIIVFYNTTAININEAYAERDKHFVQPVIKEFIYKEKIKESYNRKKPNFVSNHLAINFKPGEL
jgi:hypothetical protein